MTDETAEPASFSPVLAADWFNSRWGFEPLLEPRPTVDNTKSVAYRRDASLRWVSTKGAFEARVRPDSRI
jgi:hypothetical protein